MLKSAASSSWAFGLAAIVALGGVLGLYQSTDAQQPQKPSAPFANAVEQRMEMVAQLKAIQDLLREQNDLLRSGQVRVIVEHPKRE